MRGFESLALHFIFCISLEKKRVRGLRVVQGARGPAEKKTRRTRIRGGGEDFSKYVDRTPDYEKVSYDLDHPCIRGGVPKQKCRNT